MSLVNIISAIGNNSKVYPLLLRDCGVEVPAKVYLTYKQNLKDSQQMANDALRERSIDEYGTSAVWIGGPILMDMFANWVIKKFGFNPDVNMKLFNEEKQQGIKYNIEKFRKSAPDAVKDMEKALKNKGKYQKLQALKFLGSTLVPMVLMGVVIPKLNFKLTEKINEKREQQKKLSETNNNTSEKQGSLNFKGISATLANTSPLNKMAIGDGGLTIGRVWTGRNKYEKMEFGFKNLAMMFLNFVFPIYLAKGLDNLSFKLFKTNVNLDPKLMSNKAFINSIKNKTLEVPKEQGNIIDFLDKKPSAQFSKLCNEYCGVKYLKNGVRDPREYVDLKKIDTFKKELEKFIKEANKSGNIEKYAKKATKVKSLNIMANICISSYLLSVSLPKLIFFLRKKVTGSDAEPGLVK